MNLENLLLVYKRAKVAMGKKEFNKQINGKNTSCGDEIKIFLKIEKEKLVDLSFESQGCAISTSSTYLLTEKLKGMSLEKIKNMTEDEFIKIIGMGGVSESRRKCVLVPFLAIKQGLQ